MLHGSLVAIATPMLPDGGLDLPRLHALIDWHIAEGTAGIVIVGTTGESPTVDVIEHHTLIAEAVNHAAGRVHVMAGTGGNSTIEAIALARFARSVGADSHLSVVPYYNKPTQEGLFRHVSAIADAVDLPLVLYNVPGRTVADMHNDTVLRLSKVPNIVGVKDATGDIGRAQDLFARVRPDFACYSGDDATGMAYTLLGGAGVISVTANVVPGAMARMIAAARAGDLATARRINETLIALHRDLFVEANPIPVKWALAEMGRIGPGIRLPLTPLSAQHHDTVRQALRLAGAL
ncbi:MAG: 4-hydroxy-tetrahydrodipicolinate synthase [Pseudomonadota bacterium]|nr:4-hydroxy-tetrahydrodipicolinate synthase [Pseudomonadota bacterium]